MAATVICENCLACFFIYKLCCGIPGSVLQWFWSYLLGRTTARSSWLRQILGFRDLTAPLSEMICSRLALITINLSTRFEVSIANHYEDMKGDTKYRK